MEGTRPSTMFSTRRPFTSSSTGTTNGRGPQDNNRNLKQAIEELGQTKVSDVSGTGKGVRSVSRGLWARYVERYFVRGGGSFTPIFHVMLGIGILGYSWEYSHLSTPLYALSVRRVVISCL